MNILITGGSGFIGSHLSAFNIDKGHEVYVIDNLLTGNTQNIEQLLSNPKFHFFQEDLTTFDFSKMPEIDICFHLASPASPVQYKKYPVETMMVNGYGTYKVLEFAKTGKCKRVVLASTSETYGDPLIHPQTEDYWGNVNPVGVRSCYDEAKRYAEAMTMTYYRKYGIDVRIARIFNTYGPNMEKNDGRVVSNFIMQAITNTPITIYGDGKQTRSFCYVSDLVRGLYALGTVENISGEIINLGNPDERNMIELAQVIKELTQTQSEIIFEPIDADDPKKRKPNITKAQTLLGWEPQVSIEEGLQKAIQYFKERFL
jgi:nucleoside-diphosphate-sugar epimerase